MRWVIWEDGARCILELDEAATPAGLALELVVCTVGVATWFWWQLESGELLALGRAPDA